MIIESGDLRIRLGGGDRWTITLPNLKPGTPSTTRPDTVVQVFRRDVDSPPVASFTIDANEDDGTVTVTDTSTDAVGLDVVDIDWGDGTVDEDLAPGGTYQRQYATTDTYTIELTATDTAGQTDTASQNVSVTVLWTPEDDPGLLRWYDAGDAATFTLRDDAGTDKVEVWGDKSPNADDVAQATAARQPVYDGQKVIADGTDDFLEDGPIAITDQLTLFSLYENNAQPSQGLIEIGDGTPSTGSLLFISTSDKGFRVVIGGSPTNLTGDNNTLTNEIAIHTGVYDGATATLRSRGVDVTSASASGNIDSTSVVRVVSLFNNDFQAVDGMYTAVMSTSTDTATVERIEGWAAHAFGAEDELDAGHTYKSSPPTI